MKKEGQNTKCKECENLEKQIQELALKIDKVEDEKLILTNQLKKALADYHNLADSSEKRMSIMLFQSRKRLCDSIIPTLDSLSMAIKSGKDLKLDEQTQAWMSGTDSLFSSLNKSLEEFGLKQYIPEKGERFDPNIHEAVTTIDQGNSGEIYDLIQPGYILDSTVIRPARVVVSK